jgi:hypothetical protein
MQPHEEDDDDEFFLFYHFNGAPVEWNWQGKTEVLGIKPVPVTLCPSQIPHGSTRSNRGLRGERPATNHLSHGTASYSIYWLIFLIEADCVLCEAWTESSCTINNFSLQSIHHFQINLIFICSTCCTTFPIPFFHFVPVAKFYEERNFIAAFCVNSLQLV